LDLIIKDLFQDKSIVSKLLLLIIILLFLAFSGLFLYIGLFGLYTLFSKGELPFLNWHTNFNIVSSILMIVFLVFGYKITNFYKSKFIPIIHSQKRGYGYLPFLIIGLFVQLYFILIALTAWFPNQMLIPLEAIEGGIWEGIICSIVVFSISIAGRIYTNRLANKLKGNLYIKKGPEKIEPEEANLKNSYYSVSVLKIIRPKPDYLYQYENVRDFEFASNYDLIYISDDTQEITITQVHPPGFKKLTIDLVKLGLELRKKSGVWLLQLIDDKSKYPEKYKTLNHF